MSTWLSNQDLTYSSARLLQDVTLWQVSELNNPLWSLRLEVGFSLLLPLYVFVALRFRRYAFVLALGAVLTSAVLLSHSFELSLLPVFALGALMAARLDDLRTAVARGGRLARWGLVAGALLLLTAAWWMPGDSPGLNQAVTSVGAVALVLAFLAVPAAQKIGTRPVLQWVGARSFSLYLVHVPVLVTVAYMLPTAEPFLWVAAGVPLAVLTAVVFYRCVEAPSKTWAMRAAALGR